MTGSRGTPIAQTIFPVADVIPRSTEIARTELFKHKQISLASPYFVKVHVHMPTHLFVAALSSIEVVVVLDRAEVLTKLPRDEESSDICHEYVDGKISSVFIP